MSGAGPTAENSSADISGPTSLWTLLRLRQTGHLPASRFTEAAALCRNEAVWRRDGRLALLALGTVHLLAGVIFFFAANWQDLPAFAKFAVVEAGIFGSLAATLIMGLKRIGGRICLMAASVLTGVLFALIGQVYQSGADAYDLFVAWALLILPWTLAARDPAH